MIERIPQKRFEGAPESFAWRCTKCSAAVSSYDDLNWEHACAKWTPVEHADNSLPVVNIQMDADWKLGGLPGVYAMAERPMHGVPASVFLDGDLTAKQLRELADFLDQLIDDSEDLEGQPTEAELAEMTVEQLNAYADTFDE